MTDNLKNLEIEIAALGAVLIDPPVLVDVAAILKPDDFGDHRNRAIFQAALDLQKRGAIPDMITMSEELKGNKLDIDSIYLTRLLDCPTSLNAMEYARQVGDLSTRRRMLRDANDLAQRACDLKIPIQPIANNLGWTMAELMAADLPEPKWIVPSIIPAGLTFLGGRPKVGKSWFMLQAACAVATGGKFLGHDIEQGNVLYIALEDSLRRLVDRAKLLHIPTNAPIRFFREWRPLHKGGMDDLLRQLEKEDYRLVCLDTFARITPGLDPSAAEKVGPICETLQSIAIDENFSTLLADHLRKSNGFNSDVVEDLIQSTAKTASADAILGIYKEQGKAGANLKGRGRDIEEIDLRISFDPLTYTWQSEGDNASLVVSEQCEEILAVLDDIGHGKVSAVAKMLGRDYGNTYKKLQDLKNKGLVICKVIDGNKLYEKI